jgi:oxygen-independent coproporphyrinogen III oxidase
VKENHPNLQSVIASPHPPTSSPLFPGLYLHIPFCLSKCPYCGFYSVSKPESVDAFVQALLEEIRLISIQTTPFPHGESDKVKPNPPLPSRESDGVSLRLPRPSGERGGVMGKGSRFSPFNTIYFGGGTPSILGVKQVENILNHIRIYFNLTHQIETSFEVNPGDGDFSFFKNLFDLGINRLNLGVQSFDDGFLRFLGRRHTADQARRSIEHARRSGFMNLGIDLIYSIPLQEIDSWLETLETAVAYSPEHLSCYELTIEENTPFASEVQRGNFLLPGEETQREFFIRTSEFLEAKGYIQYEVSNFARGEEYLSRHNQKYWDHTPYLGLGPSAHSFNGDRRWWNHRSVEEYIAAVEKGILPIESFEDLTIEQKKLEVIYFGMRTRKGIHLSRFRKEFQVDLEVEKGKTLSLLMQEGLITIQKGILSPTLAGLAVADRLALI